METIDARAAVAIIEIECPQQEVLILRRTARKGDHWSAQYAFPGGRREEEDGNLLTTAIRETREEAGIELFPEQLIETLAPTPAARSTKNPIPVQPFHFLLHQRPGLHLDGKEIQGAYWLNLEAFRKPEGHAMREMIPDRLPGRLYPSWPIGDYFLWGFTYELISKVFGSPLSY